MEIGSYISGFGGEMISTIVWAIVAIIVTGVVGAFSWMFIQYSKYKYTVIILRDRNRGQVRKEGEKPDRIKRTVEIAKGGYFKVKGAWVFKVLRSNNPFMMGKASPVSPPANNYISGNNNIFMYQIGVDDYIPVEVDVFDQKGQKLEFRTEEDKDMLSYLQVNDLMERQFDWKSALQKWIVPAGIAAMGMVSIVLAWITWKGVSGVSGGGSGLSMLIPLLIPKKWIK